MGELGQSSGPLTPPPPEILEAVRVSDRIQTHARSILEGEGQDEHSPALVEAVARDLWEWDMQTQHLRTWDSETFGFRKQYKERAVSLLSTIRKHQAGE